MCQSFRKMFIVRPGSALRPSSLAENMRGRYDIISGYHMLLNFWLLGINISGMEGGGAACVWLVVSVTFYPEFRRYPKT